MINDNKVTDTHHSHYIDNEDSSVFQTYEDKSAQEIKEVKDIDLDDLITTEFKGRVVRKDLTKQLKEEIGRAHV